MTDDLPSPAVLISDLNSLLLSFNDSVLLSDDVEVVGPALVALRDLRSDLSTVFADLEAHLLACMGERTIEVEGVGVFTSRRKTKRMQWDHDDLIKDVLHDEFDSATYAAGTDAYSIATDAAAALRECVSLGAGKVKAMRARGLEPDSYCRETPDGYSVELPSRRIGVPNGDDQ